jgi:hypothetical protein
VARYHYGGKILSQSVCADFRGKHMSLPILFNETPGRLVQLTMDKSVGRFGLNQHTDVILIQSLLNAIPARDGGLQQKLAIDGVVGPLTIEAIRQYQQRHTKIVDGRIDVGGPTIMSMMRLLNSRNALPTGLRGLGAPKPEIVNALYGLTSVSSRLNPERAYSQQGGPHLQKAKAFDLVGAVPVAAPKRVNPNETGWTVVTSGSFDVSVLVVGVAIINIYMTHDIERGLQYRFTFAGSGVGVSAAPAGLELSLAAMESYGSNVYKNLESLGAKNPPFNASEFDGLFTTIISVGANALVGGWSGTLIFFGGVPAVSRYFAAMTGMQAGTPNVGITLYVGKIAGWM